MLLAAALATTAARLALLVVPWGRIAGSSAPDRDVVASARGEGARKADEGSVIPLVSWAIGVCTRRLPWATCLSNALAVRWLLARRGIAASIELGTYDEAGGVPHFHARVLCEGREIAGEREMIVLASLDA
jgi:hypothetical protein